MFCLVLRNQFPSTLERITHSTFRFCNLLSDPRFQIIQIYLRHPVPTFRERQMNTPYGVFKLTFSRAENLEDVLYERPTEELQAERL